MDLNTVIVFLNTIVIPWLILIERRLSKIEGYLKAIRKYNGCNDV